MNQMSNGKWEESLWRQISITCLKIELYVLLRFWWTWNFWEQSISLNLHAIEMKHWLYFFISLDILLKRWKLLMNCHRRLLENSGNNRSQGCSGHLLVVLMLQVQKQMASFFYKKISFPKFSLGAFHSLLYSLCSVLSFSFFTLLVCVLTSDQNF